MVDAGLGRKAEAIAEGRRACSLLPINRDGIDGPIIADNLAQIYAWCGERKAAVEQLEAVERVPNVDTYCYPKCIQFTTIYAARAFRGVSGLNGTA